MSKNQTVRTFRKVFIPELDNSDNTEFEIYTLKETFSK